MIPIPIIITAAKTFLGKNIAKIGLIAVAVCAGFYAIHLIKESGREEVRNEWKAASDESQREAAEYLKLKDIEHKKLLEKQTEYYVETVNENERLREESRINAANSANHRMFVNARVQNDCSRAGKTQAETVSGNDQSIAEIQRTELDRSTEQNIRRDYAEVDLAAKDVKVLLEMINRSQCFDIAGQSSPHFFKSGKN